MNSGKMRLNSVMLESCISHGEGAIFSLDLSLLNQISVFPGQVVVVRSHGIQKKIIVPDLLTGDASVELPTEIPVLNTSGKNLIFIPYRI